jgi:hypothetical protein
MDMREAVVHLSDRARRTARAWYVAGAIAMIVGGVAFTFAMIAVQLALFEIADVRVAIIVGLGVSAGIVAPVTRTLLRRRLSLSRPQWIEDLARVEGLPARELEQFFTLDSW